MIHNVIYAIGGIGATSAPLGDDMNDMVETNANLRAGLWEYGIPFEQGWLDKRLPGVGVWQLNVAGDFLNMFADYLMLFKLILVSKVRLCICCACEMQYLTRRSFDVHTSLFCCCRLLCLLLLSCLYVCSCSSLPWSG